MTNVWINNKILEKQVGLSNVKTFNQHQEHEEHKEHKEHNKRWRMFQFSFCSGYQSNK